MKKLLKIANNDLDLAETLGLESIYINDKNNLNLNKDEFKAFISNSYSNMIKELISNLLKEYSNLTIFDPFNTPLITHLNGTYYINQPTEIEKARFKMNNIDFSTDTIDKYDVVISDLTKVKGDIAKLFGKCLKYSNSKIIVNVDNLLIDELSYNRYIKAIISLPIYQTNNSSLLIFDLEKVSEKYILIDESNFLKGFNHIRDWTFLTDEFVNKIIPIFKNFKEDENAILVNKNVIDDIYSKKRVGSSDFKGNAHKFKSVTGKDLNSILSKKFVVNENSIPNHMYDKKMPNIENMLSKKGRQVIDDNVEFYTLNQLANLSIFNSEDFNQNTLLMSTCSQLGSKLVFNPLKINFSCNDYIEIDITSDKIIKDYLQVYLNSNKGLAEIDYFSNGNLYITPENMGSIRIPVPGIKSQKEIVEAVRQSNEFFKSVKILRDEFQENILDYQHMMDSVNEFRGTIEIDDDSGEVTHMNKNWRHVYERLIWPLAITYLSATRGGFEKTDKASKYLILFEFVAAFNSIILFSALPNDVYQKFKRQYIWNAPNLKMYNDMTFGNWIFLYRNLSKIYQNNDFSTGFDKQLFDELCDEKIIKMLNETKHIRNNHFHGAMITQKEAEFLLDDLNSYLSDIFDILEVFSKYKLIYTTGNFEKSGNNFKHRVILLNGPCKQPIYGHMTFNKILDEKSLYLYNPTNNNLLLLDEKLIKFQSVDKHEKQWGIYVFNGYFENKNGQCIAKYKYFQENEKDYFESINSFEEDIIR